VRGAGPINDLIERGVAEGSKWIRASRDLLPLLQVGKEPPHLTEEEVPRSADASLPSFG
jgi:hypothetical protein